MRSPISRRGRIPCLAALGVMFVVPASVSAADVPVFELIVKDHVFQPKELTIPADTKVKLVIKNRDSTPAEFESHELNREKVIPGNKEGIVFVGPLKPGNYNFFEEFHPQTGQGTLVVK